ncbi:MAG: nitrilase-related carbon-nitrogen hydrolase [Candidatus Paceibacterota bacterium]
MSLFFPVLSAILGILAFLPIKLWFLGFFFLAPLFVFFLKEEHFWRLIFGAFVFRLIFGLGTVYFTLEPITWLSSVGIFLGLPVVIYFFKRISVWPLVVGHWSLVILLPFLWTFFDHLQAHYSFLPAHIMTAGNIFGSSPFLGLATIGGLTLLTFFAALVNILVAIFIFKIQRLNPKSYVLNSLIIILIIFIGWQISNYQLQKNAENYNNLKNSLKVAIVSVGNKFDWQSFNEVKNKLTDKKIDLVVFPEDAFNNLVNNKKAYQELAKELNINLTATFDTLQQSKSTNIKKYNSTVLFNGEGKIVDIYNKNRLTFMGEYWPFGNWRPFFLDWIRKADPEIQNYVVFNPQNPYSRGEKKLLTIKQFNNETILFTSLICLEIHYPNDLKKYKKMGAQLIINPTSNRWADLGLNHFLYLTNNLRKIEAVWLKIPIISSGVKDFAGIIAPDGKTNLVSFENENKNYGVFIGEINY